MNFSRSRSPLSLAPPAFSGSDTGFTSAAGLVNIANNFGSSQLTKSRADAIVKNALDNRSRERQTAMAVDARTHQVGMNNITSAQNTKVQADAYEDAARAEASGSMFGSGVSALGSVASAALPLLFPPAAPAAAAAGAASAIPGIAKGIGVATKALGFLP